MIANVATNISTGGGSVSLPIGTTWTIESNGFWLCYKTGRYNLELHGCGGTGMGGHSGGQSTTYGGGGSGNLQEVMLQENEGWQITIGTPDNNGTTSMSNAQGQVYSIAKGGDGNAKNRTVGYGIGNIAGNGEEITRTGYTYVGGAGNTSNPDQTYGSAYSGGSPYTGVAGLPGAVIITYLGD